MRYGFLVGLLLTPIFVFAANTNFLGPLVPPCTEGGDGICQACNLVQLADNILKFMVVLSAMAVAIMFAYAGFLYVTAAANKQHLDSAKKIFWNALIGIIVVLCAYLLIDTVLKVLTGTKGLSPLTQIQCLRVSHDGPGASQVKFTPVPEAEEQPTQRSTYDAPAGSCVAISQANAVRFRSTPNCNPGKQVADFGDGSKAMDILKKNYGSDVAACTAQISTPTKQISPNIVFTIATLECQSKIVNGEKTCNDPANTPTPCQRGGYGISGISCDGVKTYCRTYNDPNCAGVSSMSPAALVEKIRSTPALALCSTAMSMNNSHKPGEDWADTAARYNGAGGYEPSKDCRGYRIMQCPIAEGDSDFPYCHITCAYHDKFTIVSEKAGGI